MAVPSIVLGFCLIILGLFGYFSTGRVSLTALIPVPFGVLFILFGLLARNARYRMHAMHAAATLALVSILFTFSGVITMIRKWSGAEVEPPKAAAAASKATMSVLCLLFLILCINSFVQIRLRRKAGTLPAA